MDANLKVSRAVTKCAFSHPFWGSLMLHLGHSETTELPTAATDGKHIYWNRSFIDDLTEAETRGIMAHEICHVIFMHCQPHPGKDPKLCNIAMDYVINSIILDDGFELPEGGLVDKKGEFKGMTWEQVYAILSDTLEKNKQKQAGNEPDYDTGAAPDNGMSQERQEELGKELDDLMKQDDLEHIIENSNLTEEEKADLKSKIVQAAEAAKSMGKNLHGDIDSLITEIRENKVDWREYLRETMFARFPDDYTYARPNRKMLGSGIYFPSMQGTRVGNIAVGLDTSGSVSKDEMVQYLTEINELCEEFRPEKVYLFYCDCNVAKEEVYEDGEPIDTLNARGGGGTSFVPVFDHIRDNDIEIDQMIYFSDMEVWDSCFPDDHPDYPVLFVSTRADYDVPFGDLVVAKP